jgi:UDP-N-acetylmuramoyl-tripeptide--D-alanyl-D-alanine ligase
LFNTRALKWDRIVQGLAGKWVQGNPQQEATGVSTDTRTIEANNVFVALKGPNFDGHQFISRSFDKGAAAAVVRDLPGPGRIPKEKIIIQVKDTLTALGELARIWRAQFQLALAAISGSNGKTTAKEMLAGILQLEGPTLKNPGNLNNWIGLPLSLFALDEKTRFAVLEMGMNHPGEIARLCQITDPSVALLTSIGPAHLEGLGSLQAISRAKGELFEALGPDDWAVINEDDPLIKDLGRSCRAQKITFGSHPEADVRGLDIQPDSQGFRFKILYQGQAKDIRLGMPGSHNVSNALGAGAAALSLGISLETVRQGLGQFTHPPHRLQIKKGLSGIHLIDDSYNANPASMKAALATFQSLKQDTRGGLVLGDMLELGPEGEKLHQEIGEMVGTLGVDYLLTLGPLSEALSQRASQGRRPPKALFHGRNQNEIIGELKILIRKGDWILIKGSHGMGMEKIVAALEEELR